MLEPVWLEGVGGWQGALGSWAGCGLGLVVGTSSGLVPARLAARAQASSTWRGAAVGAALGLSLGHAVRVVEWCLPRTSRCCALRR